MLPEPGTKMRLLRLDERQRRLVRCCKGLMRGREGCMVRCYLGLMRGREGWL